MPKAWQPFLRGSPPQEKLPSALAVCLGRAQRAVKNFPTAHFVRHEGRHENRLIMLFAVRPARQKIVMDLRPYSYMPQAWQPLLRGSPPQEKLPFALAVCLGRAQRAVNPLPSAHFVRHEGRHENRLIMLFAVRPARQKIVMALRPSSTSAERKASLWTAKSAVQRILTVPAFVCLGRAQRAVNPLPPPKLPAPHLHTSQSNTHTSECP